MSLAFSNFKPAFKKGYISLLKILKLISFLPSFPPPILHTHLLLIFISIYSVPNWEAFIKDKSLTS